MNEPFPTEQMAERLRDEAANWIDGEPIIPLLNEAADLLSRLAQQTEPVSVEPMATEIQEMLDGILPWPAIENLRNHQQQLDFDGCMVGVSRQALDELLAIFAPPVQPRDNGEGK